MWPDSQTAPELIDVRLVELPELLAAERQLAAYDPGWAQTRVSQAQSRGGSPSSGRTESRLCFRVAQTTYADTFRDATAMTTPQIAMTVFASTWTSKPGKRPDPRMNMLSDLSSRVTTTDANCGHYGLPGEARARSC